MTQNLLQRWRNWEDWRHFNDNTRRLLIGSAFVGLTFEGILVVLYNLYVLRLGYGPEFVGAANAAGLMSFAIMSLIVGFVGVGSRVRQLMIIGMAGIGVGMLLLPLAEIAPSEWQATLVIGCNVVYHLGVSCYFVSVPPFIMHNTRGREHVNVLAIESAGFSISAFVGSLLGGFLPGWLAPLLSATVDDPAPYRATFLLGVLLLIPAIVVMLRTNSEIVRKDERVQGGHSAENAAAALTPARAFVFFVIIMTTVRIIQSAGMNVSFTFFNVYFDEALNIAPRTIGSFTAAARLLGATLVLLMPRFVRRWGSERTLILVSLVSAVGLLILGFSPVWWLAGVGQLLALGMNSMRFTLFTSYVMQESPMRWHSLMAGLNETTGGLGFSAMALLGGYIITAQGYAALFATGASLLLLGTLVFWLYVRFYPEPKVAVSA